VPGSWTLAGGDQPSPSGEWEPGQPCQPRRRSLRRQQQVGCSLGVRGRALPCPPRPLPDHGALGMAGAVALPRHFGMPGSGWRCLALAPLPADNEVAGTKGQRGEGEATGTQGLQLVISLVFPLEPLLLTCFSL